VRSFEDVVLELTPVYQAKSHATWVEFEITTRCHLLPFYKTIPIERVGALWRHYCAGERTKNPDRKLWHDRKILRLILGYAFDTDLINKIPKLTLDPYDKGKKVAHVVSEDEIERAYLAAGPTLRDLLEVLWETGMRFGEARQLKASYINWGTGLVKLPAHIVKTRQGRSYLLPNHTLQRLYLRFKRSQSDYLFANQENPSEPLSKSYRTWNRMLHRANLSFTPHDLRHSFCSRKLAEGMPIEVLCKLIGATPEVVRQTYLHVESSDWLKFKEPPTHPYHTGPRETEPDRGLRNLAVANRAQPHRTVH